MTGKGSAGGREAGSLEFFGAITASVAHELNNVISIIDQVGGLLQDIVNGAQTGAEIKLDRLRTIHERILRQTGRGIEIIRDLNRFAHGVDEPLASFELNAVVKNFVSLTGRLVELRQARLSVYYCDEKIPLAGSPFRLQEVLYRSLKRFLTDGEAGCEISLTIARTPEYAVLEISGPDGFFDNDLPDVLCLLLPASCSLPRSIEVESRDNLATLRIRMTVLRD